MHSKFKLYSVFNGIIHIIFLLNILMYFNNGWVIMQSTEKAEKNGECEFFLYFFEFSFHLSFSDSIFLSFKIFFQGWILSMLSRCLGLDKFPRSRHKLKLKYHESKYFFSTNYSFKYRKLIVI